MYNINDIIIELPEIDLENNTILRILIDEEWTARDFHLFFRDVDILYKSKFWTYKALSEARDFISRSSNRNVSFMQFAHTPLAHNLELIKWRLKSIEKENYPHYVLFPPQLNYNDRIKDNLVVRRLQYASPGYSDFLGIAGIIKEIKESLMYYFPNKNDKEKQEIIKQQKIELQIKNLRAIGFSDIEIRTIFLREDVNFERISQFIEKGLISGVEIVEAKN